MRASYANYSVIRDKRGMTDYAVAQESGVATATISAWKAGDYRPKVEKLSDIAAVLKCDIMDLMEED